MIMKKFNVNNLKKQVGIDNEEEWDNDFSSTPSSTIITKTVVEEKLISVVNQKTAEGERKEPVAVSEKKLSAPLKMSTLGRKGFEKEDREKWMELNNRILIQDANKPWECLRETFDNLMKTLKEKNSPFVDEIFYPSENSLVNYRNKKSPFLAYNNWKRLAESYPKQKLLVTKKIAPNDIAQGALGDCYFLSALSSLAEFPARIQRLFEDQVFNTNGCYFVRICQDGIWRYVTVDDFFPCERETGKPAFARPSTEDQGELEFWVLLLEKAWAKVFGSYENIDGGLTSTVLHDLTGAPTLSLETADPALWQQIVAADKNEFVITASCGNEGEKQERFRNFGLVPEHAYSLISVNEVEIKGGVRERILELRNPWGWNSMEWNGDWSDSWKDWPADLKKKLNVGAADGRFFMSLKDFRKFFDVVTICKVHDDYYYVATPIRHLENAYSTRKFVISERTHGYISLTQYDKRHFRGRSLKNEYKYYVCRIIVARRDAGTGGLEYVAGTSSDERNLVLEVSLEAGEYYIMISIDWGEHLYDATLSYYGVAPLKFERIWYKENPDALNQTYLKIAKEAAQIKEKKGNTTEYLFFNLKDGLIVDVVENNSNRGIDVSRDFSKLLEPNFSLLTGLSGNPRVNFSLEANQSKATLIKIKDLYGEIDPRDAKKYGLRK